MISLANTATCDKRDKMVGLVIHNKARLFANGITQNAYFIYQCLENCGFKCQFLCHEMDPEKLEYRDIPLKTISIEPLIFNPTDYHTIITITRGLTNELYTLLKKHQVRIISFICGNFLTQHMDDFVRGESLPGVSTAICQKTNADEMWIIPSYSYCLEYMCIIKGISTAKIVPHLWAKTFVVDVLSGDKSDTRLFYNPAIHTNKKITILILEPNLAFCKNSWLPIIATEKLHKMFPELIDNVFVFNFPTHDMAAKMTEHLTLGPKLRKFKRLTITEIFEHFNKSKTMPIIVSYQYLNSLNYLYYESLYYGWPLVHNSGDLDGCGYFYPENDLGKCVDSILRAFHTHNDTYEYQLNRAQSYLKRVDPLDDENRKIWTDLILKDS
jgi:hypothetical protein